jgi:hypothetical protein
MRLEDLRGVHVGDAAVYFGDGQLVPAAFHHHAQVAFTHTVNELTRMSGRSVPMSWDSRIGAVEWWRTIEATVALLHRVLLIERQAGVRSGVTDSTDELSNVMEKWSAAARWFSGGKHSPPSTLTGLVTELRDFRNSFEHATRAATRDRKHSKLGESPAIANLADLMEAMAICLAACGYFRHVLPGNDLMPQVIAPSQEHVMFEPLDIVAREALFPMYNDLLRVRGLTTEVAPYDSFGHTPGQAVVEVRFVVAHQDDHPLPDPAEPIDVMGVLGAWVETRDTPEPGTFRLPAYSAT